MDRNIAGTIAAAKHHDHDACGCGHDHHGHQHGHHHHGHSLGAPLMRAGPKVGRNDACPCESGKKYKKCCLDHTARDV